MQTLIVKTDTRTQLVDVTAQVEKAVTSSGVAQGTCYLYGALDRLVPKTGPYRHSEGNSNSHVRAVLVGTSQVVPLEAGKWR